MAPDFRPRAASHQIRRPIFGRSRVIWSISGPSGPKSAELRPTWVDICQHLPDVGPDWTTDTISTGVARNSADVGQGSPRVDRVLRMDSVRLRPKARNRPSDRIRADLAEALSRLRPRSLGHPGRWNDVHSGTLSEQSTAQVEAPAFDGRASQREQERKQNTEKQSSQRCGAQDGSQHQREPVHRFASPPLVVSTPSAGVLVKMLLPPSARSRAGTGPPRQPRQRARRGARGPEGRAEGPRRRPGPMRPPADVVSEHCVEYAA